jgi:hypothetical protein
MTERFPPQNVEGVKTSKLRGGAHCTPPLSGDSPIAPLVTAAWTVALVSPRAALCRASVARPYSDGKQSTSFPVRVHDRVLL